MVGCSVCLNEAAIGTAVRLQNGASSCGDALCHETDGNQVLQQLTAQPCKFLGSHDLSAAAMCCLQLQWQADRDAAVCGVPGCVQGQQGALVPRGLPLSGCPPQDGQGPPCRVALPCLYLPHQVSHLTSPHPPHLIFTSPLLTSPVLTSPHLTLNILTMLSLWHIHLAYCYGHAAASLCIFSPGLA